MGDTALIWAANKGHTKIVEMLLAANADPNIQSDSGSTALTAAAEQGFLKICELLISANADPNLRHQVFVIFTEGLFFYIF